MPFDGTLYTVDQLREAKEYLIQNGWCRGQRFTMTGERCALGSLDAVSGDMVRDNHPAVLLLAAAIPPEFGSAPAEPSWNVARFNNAQTNVEPIFEWFDRAVALADA